MFHHFSDIPSLLETSSLKQKKHNIYLGIQETWQESTMIPWKPFESNNIIFSTQALQQTSPTDRSRQVAHVPEMDIQHHWSSHEFILMLDAHRSQQTTELLRCDKPPVRCQPMFGIFSYMVSHDTISVFVGSPTPNTQNHCRKTELPVSIELRTQQPQPTF